MMEVRGVFLWTRCADLGRPLRVEQGELGSAQLCRLFGTVGLFTLMLMLSVVMYYLKLL